MEERCRNAGVVFQPMIFESLGGISVEAEKVMKSLNKAVADTTDTLESEVATLFWHRLAIDIQRSGSWGGELMLDRAVGVGAMLQLPEGA